MKKVISLIKVDLDLLNVHHDCWFFESSLGQLDNTNSLLSKAIKDINQKNKYEKNDALWLKSTVHGDDKDRVLVRENGRGTYLASDVAYHKDKLDRGFDEIINVLVPITVMAISRELRVQSNQLDTQKINWLSSLSSLQTLSKTEKN